MSDPLPLTTGSHRVNSGDAAGKDRSEAATWKL